VGDPVSFDGSGSIPAETIVSYDWDFGDGETGTGVTVSHIYAVSGTFDVTLTVSDGTVQDSDTTTADITKKDGEPIPPKATIQVEEIPKSSGQCYTFDGSGSVDPDGEIVSYDWDLGDDNTATDEIVEHCYEESGTYTVTLTVTDDDNLTGKDSQEVIVSEGTVEDSDTTTATITEDGDGEKPPEPVCEASQIPKTNQCYRFDGSGSTDDGEIVSFEWDLGDGTTSTGEVIEYCYAEVGAYTVTLTVTDDEELTDTCTTEVTVEEE
jgi:PKD repeat protein